MIQDFNNFDLEILSSTYKNPNGWLPTSEVASYITVYFVILMLALCSIGNRMDC